MDDKRMLPDNRIRAIVVSATEERRIVTGLIVSSEFATEIVPKLYLEYFNNVYLRKVAEWCVEFYKHYGTAPSKHIQDIYEDNKKNLEPTESELIRNLLSSLSDQYDDNGSLNTEYLIESAINYFRKRELEIHKNNITVLLEDNKLEEAEQEIARFQAVSLDLDESLYIDLGDEKQRKELYEKFEKKQKHFFQMPGDLGHFIGNIKQGDVVGITAPAKRGKTISGDSLVYMSDGTTKTIKEVVEQRLNNVLCFDSSSMSIVTGNVSDWIFSGVKKEYKITLKNRESIKSAITHPFYTPDGWKPLSDIRVGEFVAVAKSIKNVLHTDIAWVQVESIEETGEYVDMYDLTVDKYHSFIANGFVLHNSFLLNDFFKHLILQKRKTVKFAIEMTDVEEIVRFDKLFYPTVEGDDREYMYPCFDCIYNQNGDCRDRVSKVIVRDYGAPDYEYKEEHIPCTKCRDVEPDRFLVCTYIQPIPRKQLEGMRVTKELRKYSEMLSKYARIVVRPKYTLSYDLMMYDLDMMYKKFDFIPQALLIDYIDIMHIDTQFADYRVDDEKWKLMQKLASATKCAVITPTQANRAGAESATLRQTDQGGFYGKGRHVNLMLGINQTPEEKRNGLYRVNILDGRSVRTNEEDFCFVLQDLKAGQMHLDSYWPNKNYEF